MFLYYDKNKDMSYDEKSELEMVFSDLNLEKPNND